VAPLGAFAGVPRMLLLYGIALGAVFTRVRACSPVYALDDLHLGRRPSAHDGASARRLAPLSARLDVALSRAHAACLRPTGAATAAPAHPGHTRAHRGDVGRRRGGPVAAARAHAHRRAQPNVCSGPTGGSGAAGRSRGPHGEVVEFCSFSEVYLSTTCAVRTRRPLWDPSQNARAYRSV
jgi:hypothetical protein